MPHFKFSKTQRTFLIAAIIFVAIFVLTYRNYLPPTNLSEQTVEETIIDTGSNNENRPAIVEPNFESVPLADTYLQNEGQGIVLASSPSLEAPTLPPGRGVRFYPFQILVWHNLVNDVWNGQPILVAYDPLCGSAAVFEREEEMVFQNSGKIYNNSMLFSVEGVDSLWRSIDGQIISGAGETISSIPSYVMTWQSFKENFPNGSALSRETDVVRDYSHNPYGNYAETPAVWYPLTKYDSTYPAKTIVYGYGSEVFPLDNIKSSGKISGAEIDFVWNEDLGTVIGLDKSGEEVPLVNGYWFCWSANHPPDPPPS